MLTPKTIEILGCRMNWTLSDSTFDDDPELKNIIELIKKQLTDTKVDVFDIINVAGYEGLGLYLYLFNNRSYAQVTTMEYDEIKNPGCDYTDDTYIKVALQELIDSGYLICVDDMYFFPKNVTVSTYDYIFDLVYGNFYTGNNFKLNVDFWATYAKGLTQVKEQYKSETVEAFERLNDMKNSIKNA